MNKLMADIISIKVLTQHLQIYHWLVKMLVA